MRLTTTTFYISEDAESRTKQKHWRAFFKTKNILCIIVNIYLNGERIVFHLKNKQLRQLVIEIPRSEIMGTTSPKENDHCGYFAEWQNKLPLKIKQKKLCLGHDPVSCPITVDTDWQWLYRVSNRNIFLLYLNMPWIESGIFYMQSMCYTTELWSLPVSNTWETTTPTTPGKATLWT